MSNLYRLELIVHEADIDLVTGLVSILCPQGWQEDSMTDGRERFTLFADRKSLEHIEDEIRRYAKETEIRCTPQDEEDWLASWKKHFTPIQRGLFLILPPWLSATEHDDKTIPVIIEPKNAFGTGQHETTALCLGLLSQFFLEKRTHALDPFLDLGTGSGILAIAAAKLGMQGIGLDIDPQAIENAKENAARNSVEKQLHFEEGSLEKVGGKTFSLLFANILAEPLIQLAPLIAKALAPNALLILSGLLRIQTEQVEEAYRRENLVNPTRSFEGEWAALCFHKEG
ncbi:MAG: 50S ribosomal protein L11 methyltransferase [Desulfovibrio sp.]|nr:50S ribosomal protein L11 methyltransferase [Desulfovibrio sp.]